MPTHLTRRSLLAAGIALAAPSPQSSTISLPDPLIAEAYEKAASLNVLAAVNPHVFPGYFSVCADGRGFGYGNTYPSLDGHQMTDALLWLDQVDTAKRNWDYVRTFQRADGDLPLAILPSRAGQDIGPKGYPGIVDANGGLYVHWVPGNPLAALASPTYIQNADVIFRRTQDRTWLAEQISSINRAADFLASLTTPEGAVGGGGYYLERPPRLKFDGVTQSHAADAFSRVAALNRLLKHEAAGARYAKLAQKIRTNFTTRFWMHDHFAEYIHPQRGKIDLHGLTDTDWAALAFGVATPEQQAVLWPRLRRDPRFYYGGMPTGIATEPDKYQDWEFNYTDRMDLAAMGRVWYVEAQARARMNDAEGLLESIRKVAEKGRAAGYYWRERYGEKGGYGAQKYCEYPANLIRIVQRFLLGVNLALDGTLTLSPLVPQDFWAQGFGQTLTWRQRTLTYQIRRDRLHGEYAGPQPQQLRIKGLTKTLPAAETPKSFDYRILNNS
ncbi:MAG TPA: hypothetical protein VGL72_12535 [Bryobacteraceae bacterium]